MTQPPQNLVQVNGITQVSDGNLNTYVQWVTTASALRNFVGLSGMTIYLQGISTIGDGGQGSFYWNSNVGQTDNGVTTIVPNGVTSGAWEKIQDSLASQGTLTTFGSTGTFTTALTSSVSTIYFYQMVGGGGGGGGSNGSLSAAAGGGSGCYIQGTLTGLAPGVNLSITVGAAGSAGTSSGGNGGSGGSTVIGSPFNITAGGGTGGSGATGSAGGAVAGGAGGTPSGTPNSLVINGQQGDFGSYATNYLVAGGGGSNPLGFGGSSGVNATGTVINPGSATGYGSGGAGAGGSGSGVAGNAGRPGLVTILQITP